MNLTNEQCIQRFVSGKPAKTRSLWTDGNVLRSYDYVLAWFHNNEDTIRYNTEPTGKILGYQGSLVSRSYDAAYSPTTNRHRDLLLHTMQNAGFAVYGANCGRNVGPYVTEFKRNA